MHRVIAMRLTSSDPSSGWIRVTIDLKIIMPSRLQLRLDGNRANLTSNALAVSRIIINNGFERSTTSTVSTTLSVDNSFTISSESTASVGLTEQTSAIPETSSAGPTASSEIPVTSSEIPVTSSEIPVTSSEIPVTSSEIPVTSSKIPMTSSASPVTSSVSPVTSITFPATSITFPATSITFPATSITFPATFSAIPATSTAVSITSSAFALGSTAVLLSTIGPINPNASMSSTESESTTDFSSTLILSSSSDWDGTATTSSMTTESLGVVDEMRAVAIGASLSTILIAFVSILLIFGYRQHRRRAYRVENKQLEAGTIRPLEHLDENPPVPPVPYRTLSETSSVTIATPSETSRYSAVPA